LFVLIILITPMTVHTLRRGDGSKETQEKQERQERLESRSAVQESLRFEAEQAALALEHSMEESIAPLKGLFLSSEG
jgi:hypothetical protein